MDNREAALRAVLLLREFDEKLYREDYQVARAAWDLISAQRGPDNPRTARSKRTTTAYIRKETFPLTVARVGAMLTGIDSPIPDLSLTELRKLEHDTHFASHIVWAFEVLKAAGLL